MKYIIKKDGKIEAFNRDKIIKAISKSAERVLYNLTDDDKNFVVDYVLNGLIEEKTPIFTVHVLVENALEKRIPKVAKSYKDYRNYKVDFVHMLDGIYRKNQQVIAKGDKSNSNSDSLLVCTKRTLTLNEVSRQFYMKFFLNEEELQVNNDGYIYIHDIGSRLDTFNCCLYDLKNLLKDGFEMGNIWYNEPKTLDVVFDVIGDVVLNTASQQYGGFTIPQIDLLLEPYAEKSYQMYFDKYLKITNDEQKAKSYALEDVITDFKKGFQGLEYKFNTVGCSRGDYPFISATFGVGEGTFAQMATKYILETRKNGQGKKGNKKPVLFPKLIFLYDEELHGEGKKLASLFDLAVDCSRKSMYPDFLSLSGEGYVADIYKKYKKVISPMGCRAFLSPYYEKGGFMPLDDTDYPIFEGRFNLGVISLNLPLIYQKAKVEGLDFYETLTYYLEIIRKLHKKTYDYIGDLKASSNPVAFMEGGLYRGHLKANDRIRPLLESATMSFGITALNELEQLHHQKSLVEDGSFSLEVMQFINDYVERIKKEDHILYAIYGTPAESLCGKQVEQFKNLYGIIKNVSDRSYVSNSFHCHVSEDITPILKQDLEKRFWDYFNGGKIQYVKYPIDYNIDALKTLIRRAMKMGFYEGVNLSLSYCDDCGYEELSMEVCPKCGSSNLTKIERMNGYLSYSRVNGDTRLNDAKMAEIKDRKSM